jgi:predicted AlkP superfamily phosphohydrolase/phosphomutase
LLYKWNHPDESGCCEGDTIRSPKVIVIGIDGATLDLMEPWMRQGKLPTFARMAHDGSYGRLKSTIPCYSAPAWVSIVTGCQPGKHGIYDFFQTDVFEKKLVNSRYRKTPALWRYLSDIGKKSIVVNVPGSYPPEPIQGVMITGLLTPSVDSQFTYPPELKADLVKDKLGEYELEQVSVDDAPKNLTARYAPEKLAQQVNHIIGSHATVTMNLMKQYPWDFTMVVFRGTDDAMHLLWDHQDLILSCYQTADRYVAEMMARYPEAVFIIVSDHGFQKPQKYLYVNNVLYNNGYIQTYSDPRSSMNDFILILYNKISRVLFHVLPLKKLVRTPLGRKLIFSGGTASNINLLASQAIYHSVCSRGIRINLKGKYPKGCVDTTQYEKIRTELIKLLKEIVDPESGKPVVQDVLKSEDVYGRDACNDPLDLILELAEGYGAQELLRVPDGLKQTKRSKKDPLPILSPPGFYDWVGDHAPYGILFMYGPGIKPQNTIAASVVDIVPTICALLCDAIPNQVDGTVIADALVHKLTVKQVEWKQYSTKKKTLSMGELDRIRKLRRTI